MPTLKTIQQLVLVIVGNLVEKSTKTALIYL